MPVSNASARTGQRRFGGALRLVLFYFVTIAATLGVYFIFYVDSRVEQTVVRNFRALDAAAVRLTELISNLHQVASNVPVGVDPDDLSEIADEIRQTSTELDRNMLEEEQRLLQSDIGQTSSDMRTLARQRDRLQEQDLRSSYARDLTRRIEENEGVLRELNADLDRIENRLFGLCNGDAPIFNALAGISSISQDYLDDFEVIPTAARSSFHPLLLRADGPTDTRDDSGDGEAAVSARDGDSVASDTGVATGEATNGETPESSEQDADDGAVSSDRDERLNCTDRIRSSVETRLLLRALGDECELSVLRFPGQEISINRRLVLGPDGIEVEARDCRRFSQRSPELDRALPRGDNNIVPVLDRFGVGVRARLADVVGNVATNVAPLFDQYLIADRTGRVIYSANGDDFRYQGVVGAPTERRERLDFANHVDVRELVSESALREPSPLDESLSAAGMDISAADGEFARYGIHSRVEDLQIGDMTFQAFVHPFEVPGLESLPDENGDRDPSTVLFMIGIVDRSSLSSESIRLRVAYVASALLMLGILVSMLPLLWLWTAGDRIMLKSWHPALLVATGLIAVLLNMLLVLHLAFGARDDHNLDESIEVVSNRIRKDLSAELGSHVQNLAEATAAMINAGEAPARAGTAATRYMTGTGNETEEEIERAYYCRFPDSRPPAYPEFDLAFIMDADGLQWQCLSNRIFDTRPINLEFRQYFQRPLQGRLWPTKMQLPGSDSDELDEATLPIFVDRITSILDGTTETVIAMHPERICELTTACSDPDPRLSSTALIGQLRSLEATILPPHIRFAVIENSSGRTLFHSVGGRSLATNFVREVEVDDALLSLVDSPSAGFVDLDYYGSSIRAYVQPLADGLPWTLVTYRGHELADTLNIIALSTTAAIMFGVFVLLFLLVAAARLLHRWARAKISWWDEASDAAFSIELLQRAKHFLEYATVAAVVLLVAAVIFLPSRAGLVATASILSVPAIMCFLIWRAASAARAAEFSQGSGPSGTIEPGTIRRERSSAIMAAFMVMATLVIIPAIGFYVDVRVSLVAGTTTYLRDATRDAIVRRCEQQTAFARRYKEDLRSAEADNVFRYGWTLLAYPDLPPGEEMVRPLACQRYSKAESQLAALDRALVERAPTGLGMTDEVLLATSGFSALGRDIAVSSLKTSPGFWSRASLGVVMDSLLQPDDDEAVHAGTALGRMSVLTLGLLLGCFLVWIIAVSITDRVLGMRLRLAMLPDAGVDPLPDSWHASTPGRLRAFVIHRSEQLWSTFLSSMLRTDEWRARRVRWNGEQIVWTEDGGNGAKPSDPDATDDRPASSSGDEPPILWVVEGFERFIVDENARDKLVNELEEASTSNAGILIWSRIIPGAWLADLTNRVSGDLASVSDDLALTSRWSQVLGPFDVRCLAQASDVVAERFQKEIAGIQDVCVARDQYRRVCRTMLREAQANPELLELAASVVRHVCTTPDATGGHLHQLALQRFRASAASHFHTIWATCSRSERLQLLALARGGFANPTRTITLSSLANRGLISNEGAVRLRSEAFKRFIIKDLDHDSLLDWQNAGHGNVWRAIWPPILLVAILAMAFFVSSTPEALTPLVAILAASLGIVPVIGSIVRGMKEFRIAPTANKG